MVVETFAASTRDKHHMVIPLAYTVPEACSAARAGRTTIYEAIKSGELRSVKRGRRTLILSQDLCLWISRFPAVRANSQQICCSGIVAFDNLIAAPTRLHVLISTSNEDYSRIHAAINGISAKS